MVGFNLVTRSGRALDRFLRASVATIAMAALPLVAFAQGAPEIAPNLMTQESADVAVLVELEGAAAARVFASTLDAGKPNGVAQARSEAASASRSQISRNESEQQRFSSALAQTSVKVTPMFRVTKAFNGLAYTVNRADIPRLRAIAGVKAVHVIEPEYPTLSTSVPFLGTPAAWSGMPPLGVTGQGIRIGIIDTGVDYQHATFGGTGLLADYQANNRTVAPDAYFPTARVVGGTDFAGDAYTGSNVATPDPDPMDCNGHGTHVASTAAGGGVNADGSPYTGPYDGTTPFSTVKLGPGVAPRANIYALRVFGCTGSTTLTVQAIEWSVDPNGDNDLSDHLDVINMSLGSNYGALAATSAIAADNAARMGVVVVASAGNAGDTYTIGGAPGSGQRVISTAAVGDSGVPGVFITVNSPPSIAGNYPAGASAMVDGSNNPTAPAAGQTGNVVLALDASNASGPSTTDGCTALTNAAAMAGNIALIDRGTCGFAIKYQNALAAGAIGMLIADNAAGAPAGISGTVVGPVTIPAARISQADGNAIKAALLTGAVNATFQSGTQGDILASFSSRGPRGGFNGVKPDLAAPGLAITAAQSGVTCASGACITPTASGYIAGSQNLVLQGTSMAAPHAAGMMALLVERFPDRSADELKAIAMNTALHDVYQFTGNINRIGVDRSGAGRIDPVKALQSTVAALNADEAGAVNLAFFGEVIGTQTQTKRVRVVNYGGTAQTFSLGFDVANDAPGIAFSLPGGNSVTVPAGGTVFVNVQVDGTAALMNHVRDVSADPTQAVTAPAALAALGGMPRHYLTNKSGYLNFSQSSTTILRVPVYAALRPASVMATPAVITTGGAPTGSTTLPLTGQQVCTGALAAGPVCNGTFPVTDVSRVSPFELQVKNPRNTNLSPQQNIRHVGTAYDAVSGLILFGIETWGDWASPSEVSFNVHVDNDSNGTFDRILFHGNSGTVSNLFNTTTAGQDVFVNGVFTPPGTVSTAGPAAFVNRLGASQANSALFGNNVIILAARPADLGLAAGVTTFKYKVQSCFGNNPVCGRFAGANLDEAAGPFSWNYAAQGLNFNGTHMAQDLNGASLPVTWNTANMTTNGSLGALVLHHHNGSGNRGQVVTLEGTAAADLGVTQVLAPAAPAQGQNVTITVTASNNGPVNATGVSVAARLPVGLTYVSDTSAGAYSSATGVWAVGALANGNTATINIVATVANSGSITMASQISGSPVDPVSGNNNASNTIVVAAQTALALTTVRTTATPVLAGGSSSFTITVKNTGIDTLLNVSVAANRAPTATITASTPSSGSFNNGTGVWSIPSIAGGITVTLNITVTAPSMAGALSVTSVATAENAPSTQQVASVDVISPASVSSTKTVSGTFVVGSTVTYTVTLNNTAATAQLDNPGAEFTDVLPAGLTLVSATASSGTATATVGTNTVTWNGRIAGGGNVIITITATINASAAATTVSNQGTVSFDADGNGSNESTALTDDPAVAGPANPTVFSARSPALVSANMTVASPSFAVGSTVTYTVTLNNSAATAQLDNPGAEFTDVLPSGVTVISATASSGTAVATVGANTVTWNGSIAAAGSVTITITATINAGTQGSTISNQGTVSFDADGNGTNESTALTDDPTVAGPANATSFVVRFATVTATKTVSVPSKAVGAPVVYTITLNNSGNMATTDNVGNELTDVLPSGTTLVSASSSAGAAVATVATNTVTWNGSVPAAGNVVITINATINSTAPGTTVRNQATYAFDADLNGSNESTGVTDDPTIAGAANATVFAVDPLIVPTLSDIALALLALMMLGWGATRVRRARPV